MIFFTIASDGMLNLKLVAVTVDGRFLLDSFGPIIVVMAYGVPLVFLMLFRPVKGT